MLLPVLPDLVANKIALGLGISPFTPVIFEAEWVTEMFYSYQFSKDHLKGPVCQSTTFPDVLAMLLV